jgi:KipI family sensor histidine kinase inhibitor
MTSLPRIEPLGERALLLDFGNRIDPALNRRVHALARTLAAAALPGVRDIVPAYASLALHYEPRCWSDGAATTAPWQRFAHAVQALLGDDATAPQAALAPATIAVRYGGDDGPDLEVVAAHAGIGADEVVRRHVAAEYHVAMLGFAPGFAYLLGLDRRLDTPRRDEPRIRVPAGSVAIGGAQTGIYPRELPGGWQVIGRTAAILFDVARDPPALLQPGQPVRFVPAGRSGPGA